MLEIGVIMFSQSRYGYNTKLKLKERTIKITHPKRKGGTFVLKTIIDTFVSNPLRTLKTCNPISDHVRYVVPHGKSASGKRFSRVIKGVHHPTVYGNVRYRKY